MTTAQASAAIMADAAPRGNLPSSSTPSSTATRSNTVVVGFMSTTALEHKLRQLKDESQQQSQLLTQKLSESQSGQNLLHMSTRLSALPPSLHSLLQQLHPILSNCEQSEQQLLQQLEDVTHQSLEIRLEQRRVTQAMECANLWYDLQAAEQIVQRYRQLLQQQQLQPRRSTHNADPSEGSEDDDEDDDDEIGAELERAAHIAQYLTSQVQHATSIVSTFTSNSINTSTGSNVASSSSSKSMGEKSSSTSSLPTCRSILPPDTERAGLILHVAPRIRKMEGELVRLLTVHMEQALQSWSRTRKSNNGSPTSADTTTTDSNNDIEHVPTPSYGLEQIGALMRSFLVLGRGKDIERLLARMAVMPMLTLSMGRLDEGGARGECAGLSSWLQQVCDDLRNMWNPILQYSLILDPHCWSMDLITCGVWVPIVTALTTDAGIQMAIFSPGIASILQANYMALDRFLSQLSHKLLETKSSDESTIASPSSDCPWEALYYHPEVTSEQIQNVQRRIYAHAKTNEFTKKWNLPIYYQLRFGECCARLNKAIDWTMKEGWVAPVYTGSTSSSSGSNTMLLLEVPLFLELYDILVFLWRPDVLLRPLTNRFLRGATQLISRIVTFCKEGMDGTIRFGDEAAIPSPNLSVATKGADDKEASMSGVLPPPPQSSLVRHSWCWGDNEQDVAVVAWELHNLEKSIRSHYVGVVCDALERDTSGSTTETAELKTLVTEVLSDTADQIGPLVDAAWNETIVKLFTAKCSTPLGAVKGVAATYRMTNRPPPTQATPFVTTILRPLKEFHAEFDKRIPNQVGTRWMQQVVVSVSDKYAAAVEELLATVQRTEVALSSRRARRVTSGGMSDGEKVKLQVYLDYVRFRESVSEVGVDPSTVIGVSKLGELTAEGGGFVQREG